MEDRVYKTSEKQRAQMKAYQEKYKERLRLENAQYRTTNKEKLAEARKHYRLANREVIKARARAYRERNREQATNYQRERSLGITAIQTNNLLDRQGFQCAICGQPDGSGGMESRRLASDHCHYAGHVRGMLCTRCNIGLGYFRDLSTKRDSITNLQNAIQYLLDHQG